MRRAFLAGLFATSLFTLACGATEAEVRLAPEPVEAPTGRLPEGVRPSGYRLSLEVDPRSETFSGSAMITVELEAPTQAIWMHGERLVVSSVHATHATTRIEGVWEQKTPDGVALVSFREPIPAGRSTLHFEYAAPFDTPLRGLYRVSSGGEWYAFTQFESISARLAFPCFDEPRFKTPFELTLTVPGELFAAANTPVDHASDLPDGRQRITFEPTPPLPTYLVALAVGPFDVVPGPTLPPSPGRPDPIPVRGLAAKGKGPLLQHALDRAPAHVEALERYFGIPYPYDKLDLVAVPDFAAGAMENVGLITFREWLLLLDEERATEGQRRAFAYVMAHELAHQWFGNLVTMPWWDDIWLNEAFATWMGDKVVHELHPEYRSDLARLSSAHRAMDFDSLVHARSIRQPVASNHDIKNAFDIITYQKGGAVLSMFEHWMGAEAFREGIQLYLARHRLGTATSSDLLAALDEVSPLDVAGPFQSFLIQPGFPLIETSPVADGCRAGADRIALSQTRYLPLGSEGSEAAQWAIPLCLVSERGSKCSLLEARESHLDLPGCSTWWMPNEQGAGYYRFSMPADAWTALRRRGLRRLSEPGRIAVADSLYASFDRGALDAETLRPWLSRFSTSKLRQLATGPMSILRFLMYDGASPEVRPRIAGYGKRLYRKRLDALGWSARKSESSDTKLLREAVIRFLVMDVRDPRARAQAARLGRAHLGFGVTQDRHAVDRQLVGLVLATAVQEGDEALFEHLLARLEETTLAVERSRILAALGHAEDAVLAERALGLTLDPRLRLNEISLVLGPQLRNPRTRDAAWRWLVTHYDPLVQRIGLAQAGNLPWYASSFCSREAAEEVEAFFEPRMRDAAGGPRNLANAIEAIELCAARVEAQRPSIDRAFAATRP